MKDENVIFHNVIWLFLNQKEGSVGEILSSLQTVKVKIEGILHKFLIFSNILHIIGRNNRERSFYVF